MPAPIAKFVPFELVGNSSGTLSISSIARMMMAIPPMIKICRAMLFPYGHENKHANDNENQQHGIPGHPVCQLRASARSHGNAGFIYRYRLALQRRRKHRTPSSNGIQRIGKIRRAATAFTATNILAHRRIRIRSRHRKIIASTAAIAGHIKPLPACGRMPSIAINRQQR